MENLPFLDKTLLGEQEEVDDVIVSFIKNVASLYRVPNQEKFLCRDCKLLPEPPVTGRCGHTRCLSCVKENNKCPCGAVTKDYSINIVIRDLIKQMMSKLKKWNDVNCGLSSKLDYKEIWTVLNVSGPDCFPPEALPFDEEQLISILPYLARASTANSSNIKSCIVNMMLKEALMHLKSHPYKNLLFREVLLSLKRVSPLYWFSQSDLECPICCEVLRNPTTTSCGHTYCLSCLENLIKHRKPCALCLKPIQELNLSKVNVTEFISEILSCMQVDTTKDVIPILTGIAAVPCMCCLIKIKPPQTFVIERVIRTKSKTFGLIDWTHDDYGTIVQIKDCILLEDGSFILTTIGTRRFQIIDRLLLDGFECARIELLCDKVTKERRKILRKLIELEFLSYMWLNKLSPEIKSDIMQTYGFFGTYEFDENSLHTPDGPSSLWWLTEVLPLHPKLKADLLVCTDLYKRCKLDGSDSESNSGAGSDAGNLGRSRRQRALKRFVAVSY